MKRRQEAAEEAERQRLQAEADAKAAAEAEAEAARQADASNRDSADAPGSPHSSRDHEAGNYRIFIIPLTYSIIYYTVNIKVVLEMIVLQENG